MSVDLAAELAADKGNLRGVERDLEELLPDGGVRGGLLHTGLQRQQHEQPHLEGDAVRAGLDELRDGELGDAGAVLGAWLPHLLTRGLQLLLHVLDAVLVPARPARLPAPAEQPRPLPPARRHLPLAVLQLHIFIIIIIIISCA